MQASGVAPKGGRHGPTEEALGGPERRGWRKEAYDTPLEIAAAVHVVVTIIALEDAAKTGATCVSGQPPVIREMLVVLIAVETFDTPFPMTGLIIGIVGMEASFWRLIDLVHRTLLGTKSVGATDVEIVVPIIEKRYVWCDGAPCIVAIDL